MPIGCRPRRRRKRLCDFEHDRRKTRARITSCNVSSAEENEKQQQKKKKPSEKIIRTIIFQQCLYNTYTIHIPTYTHVVVVAHRTHHVQSTITLRKRDIFLKPPGDPFSRAHKHRSDRQPPKHSYLLNRIDRRSHHKYSRVSTTRITRETHIILIRFIYSSSYVPRLWL